jgi:hypothetical protein
MKRNLSVSFTLAVAATLVVLIANPAYAVNCNNATLTGSYGAITALGLFTPGPNPPVRSYPCAQTSRLLLWE